MTLETTFREEEFEDFVIGLIKDANLGFKQIDSLDGYEITMENIRQVVGILPTCLVGIGEISFRDESGDGTVQMTYPAELLIYIAGENAHRRRSAMSDVRRLRRQVRQIVRGLIIDTGRGRSIVRLRQDAVAIAVHGLVIYEQVYHINVLDSNTDA
jgi:hypothetical protein